jgi:hypothetical protein
MVIFDDHPLFDQIRPGTILEVSDHNMPQFLVMCDPVHTDQFVSRIATSKTLLVDTGSTLNLVGNFTILDA